LPEAKAFIVALPHGIEQREVALAEKLESDQVRHRFLVKGSIT
jgi:hypothetical protein